VNAVGLLLMVLFPAPVPSAAPPAPPPQARPVAPPQVEDPAEPEPSMTPEEEALSVPRSDAAIDQAWLAPTAFTQPRGTLTLEAHDILATATVGVVDRLQLTFRMVPEFLLGDWFLSGGFKVRALSSDFFHLAAFANASAIGADAIFTLGAVGTACTTATCGFAFSVYASADRFSKNPQPDDPGHWRTAFLYGASAVGRLARQLKAVAELNLVGNIPAGSGTSAAGAGAGMLGLRFFGQHAALTLGVFVVARQALASAPNRANGPWLLPAVSLAGRFDLSTRSTHP
jgi:hypothetical protein